MDKLIKSIMKDLDCTEEEAKEVAEMEMKDKQNRRYEQSDITKEKKPRERKIDEGKKIITEIIEKALTNAGYNAKITNVASTIEFEDITVKVIRHRKKER